MRRSHLAVLTKLWALLCVTVGVSLTSNAVLTCTLTLLGFTYLGFQRNWRLLRSFGVFYLLLAVLLYLIRFHGFHMAIFSEFYVLVFRFFPTMRSEVKSVGRSMRNRGLTAPAQLVRHPAVSCEYVLVPLLLRCLQIADQLAVSAVARGAEYPGKRGSYYGKRLGAPDYIWSGVWTAATTVFLAVGGVRI